LRLTKTVVERVTVVKFSLTDNIGINHYAYRNIFLCIVISMVLNSAIFNNKKQAKQVAVCEDSAKIKYYQIAKPVEFLFATKL